MMQLLFKKKIDRHALRIIGMALFFLSVLCIGSVNAEISSPDPCDGNICTGELVVGEQTVRYSYTEHISPDGTLKVRLNAGTYSTGTMISHMIHDLPAFDTADAQANPYNGSTVLPLERIDPTQTLFERYDSDGCGSCIVDQVFSVDYSGLADGSHTFDLTVFHHGASGTKNDLTFYVDSGAPSNTDESESWSLPDMDEPCADDVDNDLDFRTDCADDSCIGSVGKVAVLGAICEQPETTCQHGFDNDADGLTDCLDPDCDGLVGGDDGQLCQFENEYGENYCTDGFDNDGDGLTDCLDNTETVDGQSCWKTPSYGCPDKEDCATPIDDDKDSAFSDDWDKAPTTGINCQDYDCEGNEACPAVEHRTADDDAADFQCFNGIDDDLDGLVDCADPDCLGMDDGVNICYESEFDLEERYMLCNNDFDDDGDITYDCEDADCEQEFGNCGPCPEREDITYVMCADGKDNDADGLIDCADPDCLNSGPGPNASLGYFEDAARCAIDENDNDLCSDGWDNDADGLADCADDQCIGKDGGQVDLNPVTCEASESSCSDRFDNDGDGFMDCVDSDCWTGGDCAGTWNTAACLLVPELSSFSAFASVDPTVTAAAYVSTHVNSTDVIRLVGSGTYESVAIVIGDSTDDDAVYSYAAPESDCQLTGPGSGDMSFVQTPGRVLHIFNIAGQTINGFDITLTCSTPATPESWRSYPISISMKKTDGQTEVGDLMFNHILYEDTAPTVSDIEAEGEGPSGTITLKRGESRRFRVVAEDPDMGIGSSGICSCTVEVDGDEYSTPDGDCVTGPISGTFDSDGTIDVRALAMDGVNNSSAYTPIRTFDVNVTPRMVDPPLSVRPYGIPAGWQDSPYFRDDRMEMELDVSFETGVGDDFSTNDCDIWIYNANGTQIGGPGGPSHTVMGTALGNQIDCNNTFNLADVVPNWNDGEYFVSVSTEDSDGDAVLSNRQVFYVCNSKPRFFDPENICSWADFDGDLWADAIYDNIYSADKKPCDNCVGLYNPDQGDRNANGIGEMCEPDDVYGRCETSRDVICDTSLDAADCNPPANPDMKCCPIDPDTGNPEACIQDWGLCLADFNICKLEHDEECGWCRDNGVKTDVGCQDDEDCTVVGLSGPCGSGDGFCQDDPDTSCRRDVDCVDAGLEGPCQEANICEQMISPWLETKQGNLFSNKKILAPVSPPADRYNATYCITAQGSIMNYRSELCGLETDEDTQLERPKPENSYRTMLGLVDITGLKEGRYGDVEKHTPASFQNYWNNPQPLDGKVIHVEANGTDVVVNGREIMNAALDGEGNGTVLIEGGNLRIEDNVYYQDSPVSRLSNLASLGWIVLPRPDGTMGNVYVKGSVRRLVGAFLVGGEEGFDTVAPPLEVSDIPLRMEGLVVARKVVLDRIYRNPDQGSEQIIYDGRAVANPPPGFADISSSLPKITDVP